MEQRIIITIFAVANTRYCFWNMAAPKIGCSTRDERLGYVLDQWRCLHSCEVCGKCSILRGKDAEELYDDYIEGRREYMDVTFSIRDRNY